MTLETERSVTTEPARITLVLGGGWKLGGAFHAGVVLALNDMWGVDARRVDTLIGTSSGAVVAGLLAAGMSPEDLFRRETGAELSELGRALLERAPAGEDHHELTAAGESRATGPDAAVSHHGQPWSAGGALVGLLPRGTRSMAPLERYFDGLVGPRWPSATHLQMCAVELGSGRRVALTKDCGATLGQAVAASCSIPGVSAPVRIHDREYVDGAIHSINNADLAMAAASTGTEVEGPLRAESGRVLTHTVVVSAPLSARNIQLSPAPIALLRNTMRAQTRLELRKLADADHIVLVEPTAADIAAMGSNLNANNRRRRVARRAYVTASGVLEQVPAHSERHG